MKRTYSTLLCVLAVLAGCDGRPKRVPVSGTVLIDGVPLSYGAIDFVPDKGRASSAVLDSSGHFTLSCFTDKDGALIGKHRVRIHANEEINSISIRVHAPTKYEDLAESGLTQEITSETDSLAINLTWKGSGHSSPYTVVSGARGDEDSPRFQKTSNPQ